MGNPRTVDAPRIGVLYYNPRTLYAGSAEPLSETMPPRNLPRTGWGPRGDSGPERDRVRATQPASFFPLPSPCFSSIFLCPLPSWLNSAVRGWTRKAVGLHPNGSSRFGAEMEALP